VWQRHTPLRRTGSCVAPARQLVHMAQRT
jgi:hypothetical protein